VTPRHGTCRLHLTSWRGGEVWHLAQPNSLLHPPLPVKLAESTLPETWLQIIYLTFVFNFHESMKTTPEFSRKTRHFRLPRSPSPRSAQMTNVHRTLGLAMRHLAAARPRHAVARYFATPKISMVSAGPLTTQDPSTACCLLCTA